MSSYFVKVKKLTDPHNYGTHTNQADAICPVMYKKQNADQRFFLSVTCCIYSAISFVPAKCFEPESHLVSMARLILCKGDFPRGGRSGLRCHIDEPCEPDPDNAGVGK